MHMVIARCRTIGQVGGDREGGEADHARQNWRVEKEMEARGKVRQMLDPPRHHGMARQGGSEILFATLPATGQFHGIEVRGINAGLVSWNACCCYI